MNGRNDSDPAARRESAGGPHAFDDERAIAVLRDRHRERGRRIRARLIVASEKSESVSAANGADGATAASAHHQDREAHLRAGADVREPQRETALVGRRA